MQTERFFNSSSRYVFDYGLCSASKGYAQIDTSQDAPYFGTWANANDLIIVTYCEGDVTIERCDTAEEFRLAVMAIKTWNDENGHVFKGIDTMCQSSIAHGFVLAMLDELFYNVG